MEGMEKPKSFLERAVSKFSYWMAEREAHNLDDRYKGKMQELAGKIADTLGARGVTFSSEMHIVPPDDPFYMETYASAEEAVKEVRKFEKEELGMSEDSPELRRAIEDLQLAQDLEAD